MSSSADMPSSPPKAKSTPAKRNANATVTSSPPAKSNATPTKRGKAAEEASAITPAMSSPASSSSGSSSPSLTPSPKVKPSNISDSKCPWDLDDWLMMSVHTAKCDDCDDYNRTDKMRQCPICGSKLCLKCQGERKEKGLLVTTHGDLRVVGKEPPPSLFSDIARTTRTGKVVTPARKSAPTTPAKTNVGKTTMTPSSSGSSSGSSSVQTSSSSPLPAKTKKEATTPTAAGRQEVKDKMVSEKGDSTAGKNKRKRNVAVDDPAPPSSSPPSTGAIKKDRAVRSAALKRPVVIDSSSSSSDKGAGTDDENADPEDLMSMNASSPSVNKRVKLSSDARGRTQATATATTTATASRNNAAASRAARQPPQPAVAPAVAPASQEESHSSPPAKPADPAAMQSALNDRAAVRAYLGPTLDAYSTAGHPMARQNPVTSNPAVRIPPNVANGFNPTRRSGAEIQKILQDKLRARLGWPAPSAASTSNSNTIGPRVAEKSSMRGSHGPPDIVPIRDFIVNQVRSVFGKTLSDEQRGALFYPVRKHLEEVFSDYKPKGALLDEPIILLREEQKEELIDLVEGEAVTILRGLD